MSAAPPPALSPSHGHPPVHVAIIMDGNGRWAKQRKLPRIEGHRRGVETVRAIIDATRELGSALGVAVLGSIAAARYGSGIGAAVARHL